MNENILASASGYTFVFSIIGFLAAYLILKVTSSLSLESNKQWVAFLLTWGLSVLFYVLLSPYSEDSLLSFAYPTVAGIIAISIIQGMTSAKPKQK